MFREGCGLEHNQSAPTKHLSHYCFWIIGCSRSSQSGWPAGTYPRVADDQSHHDVISRAAEVFLCKIHWAVAFVFDTDARATAFLFIWLSSRVWMSPFPGILNDSFKGDGNIVKGACAMDFKDNRASNRCKTTWADSCAGCQEKIALKEVRFQKKKAKKEEEWRRLFTTVFFLHFLWKCAADFPFGCHFRSASYLPRTHLLPLAANGNGAEAWHKEEVGYGVSTEEYLPVTAFNIAGRKSGGDGKWHLLIVACKDSGSRWRGVVKIFTVHAKIIFRASSPSSDWFHPWLDLVKRTNWINMTTVRRWNEFMAPKKKKIGRKHRYVNKSNAVHKA